MLSLPTDDKGRFLRGAHILRVPRLCAFPQPSLCCGLSYSVSVYVLRVLMFSCIPLQLPHPTPRTQVLNTRLLQKRPLLLVCPVCVSSRRRSQHHLLCGPLGPRSGHPSVGCRQESSGRGTDREHVEGKRGRSVLSSGDSTLLGWAGAWSWLPVTASFLALIDFSRFYR